jgi:hypothetical protein
VYRPFLPSATSRSAGRVPRLTSMSSLSLRTRGELLQSGLNAPQSARRRGPAEARSATMRQAATPPPVAPPLIPSMSNDHYHIRLFAFNLCLLGAR